MTRRQMQRRLRARLDRDERGFTLIETMIAITVIFGSLVVLAYAATASFRYQDIARQRQGANGVAAKVMEEIRGLAYEKITSGLSSNDLTGDANIVPCAEGAATVYRFLSCTAGSDPGSGEEIVNSPGLTTTVPLVPHRSSTSPNTDPVVSNIPYTWATYVTRDDSVANAPYRVTVIVTWTKGLAGATKLVRVQSLFWSPIGCASTATHPFAAPCQSFYLGNATVPNGNLTATGTIAGTTFSSMSISLTGASATVQQEQIAAAESAVHPVEGSITDTTTTTAGGVTVATDADADPNTVAAAYARKRCGIEVTCAGDTITKATSADGQTFVGLNIPTTTSGESDSATAASGSQPCPPSLISTTSQTDAMPCAGAAIQQPSTVIMGTAHLNSYADIGGATLLRVGLQSNQTQAFVDRVINPAPTGALCTPAAGSTGCVQSSVSRTYANIRLGGFPDQMTPPLSSGNCTVGGDFYLVHMVGYTGSASAVAGFNSPNPVASAPGGTLYYYNPSTGGCSSLPLSSPSITGLDSSYTTTQSVDGVAVTVSMSTVTSETTAAAQSTTATVDPTTSTTVTYAKAQCAAPVITVRYTISIPGTTIMDVTSVVNLGTLTADATYSAAPTGA